MSLQLACTMTQNQISSVQSAQIAVAAGLGSAMVNHPFNVVRARFQNRLALPVSDRTGYPLIPRDVKTMTKGFSATFYSQLASTTFQTFFRNQWKNDEMLSKCSPIAGGFVTSTLATPLESAMLRQSKSKGTYVQGGTFYQSYKFFELHGFRRFYLGYFMTSLRSVSVGSGFSMFMPLMTQYLEDTYHWSRSLSLLVSGAIVGTVWSAASQPFEALRIEQQFTADEKEYYNIRRASKSLWKQGGIKGLFKGGSYRIPRTAPGILVMGAISQQMEEHFLASNSKRLVQ